jgi:hypothetical protein
LVDPGYTEARLSGATPTLHAKIVNTTTKTNLLSKCLFNGLINILPNIKNVEGKQAIQTRTSKNEN